MNIIQLLHKNLLDQAYSESNKCLCNIYYYKHWHVLFVLINIIYVYICITARNTCESNSLVGKASLALLAVYRNILEFHNTGKNGGNFEILLQQFQSLIVEQKAYTDLFAETYVLLLLKVGKETEALNFLYQ